MKKIAIVSLIALVCWLYPIKVLGQKTDEPKPKLENKQPESVIYKPNEQVGPIEPNRLVLPPAKKAVPKPPAPPVPTGYSGRDYSKSEVEALIREYSRLYGVDENLTTRIAYCESGYNQSSKNKTSSASGVFQYLSSTWANTSAGKQGISVFDAEANVKMAVSSIATHGTAPWNASRKCWSN